MIAAVTPRPPVLDSTPPVPKPKHAARPKRRNTLQAKQERQFFQLILDGVIPSGRTINPPDISVVVDAPDVATVDVAISPPDVTPTDSPAVVTVDVAVPEVVPTAPSRTVPPSKLLYHPAETVQGVRRTLHPRQHDQRD